MSNSQVDTFHLHPNKTRLIAHNFCKSKHWTIPDEVIQIILTFIVLVEKLTQIIDNNHQFESKIGNILIPMSPSTDESKFIKWFAKIQIQSSSNAQISVAFSNNPNNIRAGFCIENVFGEFQVNPIPSEPMHLNQTVASDDFNQIIKANVAFMIYFYPSHDQSGGYFPVYCSATIVVKIQQSEITKQIYYGWRQSEIDEDKMGCLCIRLSKGCHYHVTGLVVSHSLLRDIVIR